MNCFFKVAAIVSICFGAGIALASGGGEHIPWRESIIPQAVNLALLSSVLFYFLAKPVKAHFAKQKQNFDAAVTMASAAKEKAELIHATMRAKINEVDTTAKAEAEEAKINAAAMSAKILEEAKLTAKRIEADSLEAAQQELGRAVVALKQEYLVHSFDEAKISIRASVDDHADEKLQKAFVSKAKAVQL